MPPPTALVPDTRPPGAAERGGQRAAITVLGRQLLVLADGVANADGH